MGSTYKQNLLFLLLDWFYTFSSTELWQGGQKHSLGCHIKDFQKVEVTKHSDHMVGDEKKH